MRLSYRGWQGKSVSNTWHGLDIGWIRRVWFNLAPQTMHYLAKHVPVAAFRTPYMIDDRLGGQHVTSVKHEIVEKASFERGKRDGLTLADINLSPVKTKC